jgi:hypothetical protein
VGELLRLLLFFGREAEVRSQAIHICFLLKNGAFISLAKTGGGCSQRIQHTLQVEGRAADDLEHISGGGLLLKGFAQLAEQPRIFNSDDSLRGEVFDQLNLLVGE